MLFSFSFSLRSSNDRLLFWWRRRFFLSTLPINTFTTVNITTKMRQPLEKEIKKLLWKDKSKEEVYKVLVTETNKPELIHLLNNLPTKNRRTKTFLITLFLVVLLALLTTKQLLFIYLHENSNVSLILGFIGPIIHVYIMRELLLSHRLAYQILPLLSILALFRLENRILPDAYMYISMAVLSGVLYLFLFPKSEQLRYPVH